MHRRPFAGWRFKHFQPTRVDSEEIQMLQKFSLIAALMAAVMLPVGATMTMLPTEAVAGHGHGHHGHGHHGHGHYGYRHYGHGHYGHGYRYYGHGYYGHRYYGGWYGPGWGWGYGGCVRVGGVLVCF
jgi:hypothetical protein